MQKKWITKAEEKQIIQTYELYKGEIVHYQDKEHIYEITTVRRSGRKKCALIKVEPEADPYIHDMPRIMVRHSDSNGQTIFVDVWDRDTEGKLYWKYRNPINVPLSDREAIRQIEEKMDRIKKEYQKIKETKVTKPAGRKPHPEKLDENARKIRDLLEQGYKEKDIIKKMKISRATYYRYKKYSRRGTI